ncbi:unnamed protein product [Ambrosiozyma monospora]|uniref:Unnamed protein product n=1 Tax=Ambrosiozyma monospora TaxID=43982 RepID=A0ACB5SXY9_AMBMO|nr:unnamed protein product [Ambrosiozyma monospora]
MRNHRHKQAKSSAPKADSAKSQTQTTPKQREIDSWITQSYQQCHDIPTEHIEKIIYNDSLLLLMEQMDLKDDEKENSSKHTLVPPPTSQNGPVTTSPQKFAKTTEAEGTTQPTLQLPKPLSTNLPIIQPIPAFKRPTSSNGVIGFKSLMSGGGATRRNPLLNHSSTETHIRTTTSLPTKLIIQNIPPSSINSRLDIDGLGQIKYYSFDSIKDKFLNPQLFQHHKLTLDYINQSNYPPQTLQRIIKRPKLNNLTCGIAREKFEYLLNTSCPKSASSNELNAVRLLQDPELKANAVTYRYSRYIVSTNDPTGFNNDKNTNPYDRSATFMKGNVTYQQELKQLSIMCRFCPHKRWVKAQNFKLHLGLAHGIICLDDPKHKEDKDRVHDDVEYESNSSAAVNENEVDSDVSMDDADSDVQGQPASSYQDQTFSNDDDDDELEDKDNESEEMYLDEWDQLADFEVVVLPKPKALFEATPRGVKRYHCQCPKCLDWIRLGFPEPLGNASNVADSNLPLAFGTGNVGAGKGTNFVRGRAKSGTIDFTEFREEDDSEDLRDKRGLFTNYFCHFLKCSLT